MSSNKIIDLSSAGVTCPTVGCFHSLIGEHLMETKGQDTMLVCQAPDCKCIVMGEMIPGSSRLKLTT